MSPLSLQLPFAGLGSETELRALADALPHGVFTIDATGVITFWSAGAERITGYPRAEAVGRPCSILAGDAPDSCACQAGPFRCGLAEKGRSAKTCSIRTRDGRQVRIVKNAVPLLGEDGAPVGALEAFAETGDVLAFAPTARDAVRAASRSGDFCGITGRHPAMRELYRMIELVARSDAPVIVLGESGTGKDLVAAAIHRMGPRAAGPLVRASCAVLSDGIEGGGAMGAQRTVYEEASGGTLVLDEVGDLSASEQARLLRIIERRTVERPGTRQPVGIDVRLVCTTHQDLPQLVAAGRFRPDLYFRLAVFPLRVPALRDRLDDVKPLAEAFLAARGSPACVGPAALATLRARPWPGNVRELHNVLEFAMLQARGGELRPEFLPRDPAAAGAAPQDERAETLAALARERWNRTRAAAALGISRVTLWKRMRRHGLAPEGSGDGPET